MIESVSISFHTYPISPNKIREQKQVSAKKKPYFLRLFSKNKKKNEWLKKKKIEKVK